MTSKATNFEFTVEDIPNEVEWFKGILTKSALSHNSVESYCWTIQRFLALYNKKVNPDTLLKFKEKLIKDSEPQTVNNRINGMNRYLKEKSINYKLPLVKIVEEQFNDKVITLHDYIYLKRRLKEDKDYQSYFLIWALGCTGARVSEIVQLKVEHIYDETFRIMGKGIKTRTIFLSHEFCEECREWVKESGIEEGYLFQNRNKTALSKSSVETKVKKLAYKYNIDPEIMYPHSFRHMFAKEFHKRENDLILLKDIMGHSSIDTTVLYCKPTLNEVLTKYNQIVDW